MALTRKLLKGMGLSEEQVDTIIEAHMDTVDGLKAEATQYKSVAEKLLDVQKELDTIKAAGDGGWEEKAKDWEKKYTDLVADNARKETQTAKERAYRELLKDASLSDKGVEKALKYARWESVELDEAGKIKNPTDHIKSVKEEWSDFVTTTTTAGADTANPPATTTGQQDLGKLSMEDYIAARKKM